MSFLKIFEDRYFRCILECVVQRRTLFTEQTVRLEEHGFKTYLELFIDLNNIPRSIEDYIERVPTDHSLVKEMYAICNEFEEARQYGEHRFADAIMNLTYEVTLYRYLTKYNVIDSIEAWIIEAYCIDTWYEGWDSNSTEAICDMVMDPPIDILLSDFDDVDYEENTNSIVVFNEYEYVASVSLPELHEKYGGVIV